MNQDKINWNRSTYSMLDYLGDLGGLLNGLRHSCAIVVAPLTTFTLKRQFLFSIFSDNKRKPAKTVGRLSNNQRNQSASMGEYKSPCGVHQFICCFFHPKSRRLRQLISISQAQLRRELDLRRMIERQRMTRAGILTLFGSDHLHSLDKLSRLILKDEVPDNDFKGSPRESSSSGESDALAAAHKGNQMDTRLWTLLAASL